MKDKKKRKNEIQLLVCWIARFFLPNVLQVMFGKTWIKRGQYIVWLWRGKTPSLFWVISLGKR
jgi:hypothetical protein